jgi:hypothetical protein
LRVKLKFATRILRMIFVFFISETIARCPSLTRCGERSSSLMTGRKRVKTELKHSQVLT